jgi:hypothetical protein
MPMILVASLLLVQAPAAASPAQPVQPIDVTGQKKPKEVCKVIEVTGSRMRQRVCKKEGGDFDLGPNVSDAAAPGMFKSRPVAQPGGLSGPSPQ